MSVGVGMKLNERQIRKLTVWMFDEMGATKSLYVLDSNMIKPLTTGKHCYVTMA